MGKRAIIAGATGLIGNHLLKILLEASEYEEVTILVRKSIPLQHAKLKQLVLNFDNLDSYSDQLKADVIFSCLGSTRKKTPDKKEYYKIDHDYPVKLGEIAKKNNIAQYHLISAIGANPDSSVFYTKMKGETEVDLSKLHLPSLYIYQPSMIAGNRQEHRSMEKALINIWEFLNPLLIGGLKKYRSTQGETIAQALYKNSLQDKKGKFVLDAEEIKNWRNI